MAEYGPTQGKGDAMWRALSVARGDIVMFADADTADFGEHFVYGTLGPLLADPGIRFCKAAYRRPYATGEKSVVDGGGRVTELMAKPLLNRFYPELTGFVQPLAGEFAAHRDLVVNLPFLTGYGVEIGLLIDVLADVGLAAMAQVDLGVRQNRHQPLRDLAEDELGHPARDVAAGSRAGAAAARGRIRPVGVAPTGDLPARGGRRGRAAAR